MKIVVAQDALHAEGGVETYLASVIPALRERGHSVGLLFVERRGTPLISGINGPSVAVDPGNIDAALTVLKGQVRPYGVRPDERFWVVRQEANLPGGGWYTTPGR